MLGGGGSSGGTAAADGAGTAQQQQQQQQLQHQPLLLEPAPITTSVSTGASIVPPAASPVPAVGGLVPGLAPEPKNETWVRLASTVRTVFHKRHLPESIEAVHESLRYAAPRHHA